MEYNDNTVLNRIKYCCQERNWTMYRLAKESGIPYSNLNNLINRNTVPTIPTLYKICEGLGITLSEFFNDEQFQQDNSFKYSITLDEAKLIEIYKKLNSSEKELLIAYISGLAKLKL